MKKQLEIKPFEELAVEGPASAIREPIERELEVVRRLPNPRMVLCEYWELESRRTCIVNVRKNQNFFKRMRFKMEEPIGELEFSKAWMYTGKLPRRKGRW